MSTRLITLTLLILFSPSLWAQDKAISDFDNVAMDRAMQEARATIDDLLRRVESGSVKKYNIKAPVVDVNGTEYFWLSDVTFTDGVFKGKIDNDPNIVKTVKICEFMTIKKDNISDWMFMRDGKIYGNRTLRVLLPTMDKAEADNLKKMLAPLK